MKHNNSHNDQHTDFFKKVIIPYEKSKDEVWAAMMEKLNAITPQKKSNTRKLVIYWSVAATIAILLGVTTFMRLYTITLYVPAGEHVSKLLPDGSKIYLNANTTASYNPYWWQFKRNVELTGEAYFEVTKGNSFTVVSDNGTTRVLGTSFNIYARKKSYRVHCITGKVEVKSNSGNKTILTPNKAVAINTKGEFNHIDKISGEHAISWTKNTFIFTAAPLVNVFEEMERQFDIEIIFDKTIQGSYTGNFVRGSSPEDVLNVIARPFGLKVSKIHDKKFKISP